MLEIVLSEENPFFHRGPVHNQRYFFGRSREMQRILRFVKRGQSVSLVGPRRIGKSSLLWQLCNPKLSEAFTLEATYHFVFIDCQELSGDTSQSDIYEILLSALYGVMGADERILLQLKRPLTYRTFEKQIAKITHQACKIVFILDEFEMLASNPHLDKSFFTQLRALGQKGDVIYITASGTTLHELTYYDQNVLNSPFFNIFSIQWLGLITNADFAELIDGLLQANSIHFREEDKKFIQNLAGAYPFFTQLAAYLAFEEKLENLCIDYEKVTRQFMREARGHFEHMWRNLNEKEKEALNQACRLANVQMAHHVRDALEQKCLLVDDRIFSQGFAKFVLAQNWKQPFQRMVTTINNFTQPGSSIYQSEQSAAQTSIHLTGDIKPAHRIFVREMFKQKDVEQADFRLIRDGYANFGMYLVKMRPANERSYLLSNVLKFASAKDIQATKENYKKYIKDRLSIAFPDDPEFWFPPDIGTIPKSEWANELAASMYRYALTDGETVHNLQDIYQLWLSEQQNGQVSLIDPVGKVLLRLFRILEQWQGSVKLGTRLLPLIDEYKRLYNKLGKIEAKAVQLSELDLANHLQQPQQFRYEEKVMWRGRQFTNPIYWVEQLFQQPAKRQWLNSISRRRFPGIVHGDLNFRNILVEKSGHDLTSIWLIDFADIHAGHPLRDYGTLEADLKFVITPITAEDFAAVHGQDPPILRLEKLLLSPQGRHEIDLEHVNILDKNIRLRAIWTYTRQIRSKVRENVLQGVDVRPYFLSLLHATLPALYYEQLSSWQHLYAFLSAALICEAIDALENANT